jgi:hypothetical protein
LHAESLPNEVALRDNQMVDSFVLEMTLLKISIKLKFFKVTNPLSLNFRLSPVSADLVWPEENEIDLSLALLTKLKILAMNNQIHFRLMEFIIQIMIWLRMVTK